MINGNFFTSYTNNIIRALKCLNYNDNVIHTTYDSYNEFIIDVYCIKYDMNYKMLYNSIRMYNLLPLFKYLISGIKCIKYKNNILLRCAASNGNLPVMEYLYSVGLTLEDIRVDNNFALRSAASNGHLKMVKYLYSRGLTLEDIRTDNNAAIILSSKNGYVKVARWLYSKGLTLDDIRTNNNEAIRYSVKNGHISMVRYLCSRGLTIDDIRSENNYIHIWGYINNNIDILRYLNSIYNIDNIVLGQNVVITYDSINDHNNIDAI